MTVSSSTPATARRRAGAAPDGPRGAGRSHGCVRPASPPAAGAAGQPPARPVARSGPRCRPGRPPDPPTPPARDTRAARRRFGGDPQPFVTPHQRPVQQVGHRPRRRPVRPRMRLLMRSTSGQRHRRDVGMQRQQPSSTASRRKSRSSVAALIDWAPARAAAPRCWPEAAG